MTKLYIRYGYFQIGNHIYSYITKVVANLTLDPNILIRHMNCLVVNRNATNHNKEPDL